MNPVLIGIGVTIITLLQLTVFFFGVAIGRSVESRKTVKALRKVDKLEGELSDLQDFRSRACETYKNKPN